MRIGSIRTKMGILDIYIDIHIITLVSEYINILIYHPNLSTWEVILNGMNFSNIVHI